MSIKIASMNFGDCDTIMHNTTNGMKNIAEVLGPNGEVYWSAIKELTGVLPLSIRSNGMMLLDYLISGNMSQTDTPTPDNPITPSECGERTSNLANMYGIDTTGVGLTFKTDSNMTVKINGTKRNGANIRDLVHPNIMLPAGKYTIKIKMIGGSIANITGGIMFGINKSDYSMRTVPQVNTIGQVGTRTFTLDSDTLLTSLDITPSYGDTGAIFNDAVFQCWLYSGDGDVPYEPYGYKIPISSAGQTTTVYLGEVETTRRIKKLVLTGEENWYSKHLSANLFNLDIDNYVKNTNSIICLCTHYKAQKNITLWTNVQDKSVCFFDTTKSLFYLRDSNFSTVADLKSYLTQQYANGTPVTIWYILATPETGIVNEPLRKIGDYADTVSYEQAGVQIPTNKGNTVIDVDTTLKPSQMYIKYK